ncbi:MAG: apolipoprotein N-acyltransferase [Sphingomonadales bacterium]|nr:apolipoprotein N-acyltransferase [Sphingomonadales bacterium]MBD3772986.1 apolipoprotein N-acyltransferase [Paracoccaceae bacterium]
MAGLAALDWVSPAPLRRHPRLFALACGLIAATGFPPLALWPLALLALAGMAWLVHDAPGWREALLRGWLFGIAHFTLANNWIATAFTYQAEMPVVLGWVAVPLLSLYLAIFPALAALGGRAIGGGRSLAGDGAAFAGSWIVAEWLRGWLFSGFAWDPLGLVFLGSWDRAGIAAVLPWLGSYALSGMVILAALCLLVLALGRHWVRFGMACAVLAAAMYWPAPPARYSPLRVTLVQPDLRQEDIDDPSQYEDQFLRIAKLSQRSQPGRRLVLWPESGVPDYLEDGYPQRYYNQMTAAGDPVFARRRIGRVIGADSMLLTGVVNLEIEGGKAAGAYNAVDAITPAGEIVGIYNKSHLVPYGEYLPMREILEPLGLSRLVAGAIDFIPGPGARTIDVGAYGKAGVQICYEIVFPGEVVDRAHRPDYIYNPSNDGWFGMWGPPQHLAQARMRAIEEGLPVLRSTTTGISAIVDAGGVVRHHIAKHVAGRIEARVPVAREATAFARLGNALSIGWALVLLVIAAVARRARRR